MGKKGSERAHLGGSENILGKGICQFPIGRIGVWSSMRICMGGGVGFQMRGLEELGVFKIM